ncbi:hypothetical protein [Streptomyces similanensis]|uniref:Uncharacterized protein n=1 Tax=Streptomyces similanensis TaxID=1274988 RepID=A0ABP9LML6_9ACTN
MSVLQFASSIAWPLVALCALGLIGFAIRSLSPDTVRTAFLTRDLNLKVPGGLEVGWSVSPEALRAATATDESLALTQSGQPLVSTSELRREAVEQIVAGALRAGWSWGRGALGSAVAPPEVRVDWTSDMPQVTVDFAFPESYDGEDSQVAASRAALARALAGREISITVAPPSSNG